MALRHSCIHDDIMSSATMHWTHELDANRQRKSNGFPYYGKNFRATFNTKCASQSGFNHRYATPKFFLLRREGWFIDCVAWDFSDSAVRNWGLGIEHWALRHCRALLDFWEFVVLLVGGDTK